MPKVLTREQIQKDFPEIWNSMISKGLDFQQAKALYRKQLEKSLAGYESQIEKDVAIEKERLTNEIFETAKKTAFAMVRENYGIEFVEDPESGEIIFENEEIFNFLIPLLKQLSSILAHPESTHVSIELTRDENDEWDMKIVNRAE